jgi:hypothetical protein
VPGAQVEQDVTVSAQDADPDVAAALRLIVVAVTDTTVVPGGKLQPGTPELDAVVVVVVVVVTTDPDRIEPTDPVGPIDRVKALAPTATDPVSTCVDVACPAEQLAAATVRAVKSEHHVAVSRLLAGKTAVMGVLTVNVLGLAIAVTVVPAGKTPGIEVEVMLAPTTRLADISGWMEIDVEPKVGDIVVVSWKRFVAFVTGQTELAEDAHHDNVTCVHVVDPVYALRVSVVPLTETTVVSAAMPLPVMVAPTAIAPTVVVGKALTVMTVPPAAAMTVKTVTGYWPTGQDGGGRAHHEIVYIDADP